MAFRFLTLLGVLSICTCFSQTEDSIAIENVVIKDTLAVQNETTKVPVIVQDSLVQDNTHIVTAIEAEVTEIDSTSLNHLKDNEFVLKLDEAWFEELYSNNLFDTIYKSVTDLDYQPVDYPELSTDTLKARLNALNARTPFNVEYNPSLESVIKSYLKHRRQSIQKLLTLSGFYFPMLLPEKSMVWM